MKISELFEAEKTAEKLKQLIGQTLDSSSLNDKSLSAVELINIPSIRNLMPGLTDKQAKDKVNNILSRHFKDRGKRGGLVGQLKQSIENAFASHDPNAPPLTQKQLAGLPEIQKLFPNSAEQNIIWKVGAVLARYFPNRVRSKEEVPEALKTAIEDALTMRNQDESRLTPTQIAELPAVRRFMQDLDTQAAIKEVNRILFVHFPNRERIKTRHSEELKQAIEKSLELRNPNGTGLGPKQIAQIPEVRQLMPGLDDEQAITKVTGILTDYFPDRQQSRPKFTPDQIKFTKDEFAAGKPVYDIATRLGKSPSGVKYLLGALAPPDSPKAQEYMNMLLPSHMEKRIRPKGASFAEINYFKVLQATLDFPLLERNKRFVRSGGYYPYNCDGVSESHKIIVEFYGDRYHANPKKYPNDEQEPIRGVTAGSLRAKDKRKEDYLKSLGYNVLVIWENDWRIVGNKLNAINIVRKAFKLDPISQEQLKGVMLSNTQVNNPQSTTTSEAHDMKIAELLLEYDQKKIESLAPLFSQRTKDVSMPKVTTIQALADYVEQDLNVKSGEITFWILHKYLKKLPNNQYGINRWEDVKSRVIPNLRKFEILKNKKKIPPEQRDLNRLKSLSDLEAIVDQFDEQDLQSQTQQTKSVEQQMFQNGDAKLIHDDAQVKVVQPLTEKGSCYFGINTKWCTAGKENNAFNLYAPGGPIYIVLIKKTNNRYQFHWCITVDHNIQDLGFEDVSDQDKKLMMLDQSQFMDEQDNPINPNKLADQYPVLWKIFGPIAQKNKSLILNPSPSEQLKHEMVQLHPFQIEYIKNPSLELQQLAVQGNPKAIQYVDNPHASFQQLHTQMTAPKTPQDADRNKKRKEFEQEVNMLGMGNIDRVKKLLDTSRADRQAGRDSIISVDEYMHWLNIIQYLKLFEEGKLQLADVDILQAKGSLTQAQADVVRSVIEITLSMRKKYFGGR